MYIYLLKIILIGLSAILVALSIFLFLIRFIKSSRNKRASKIKSETIHFIEKIVFQINTPSYNKDWILEHEKLVSNFKNNYVIKSSFDRQIITHELLTLHRSLKGIATERIRDLYINLGFAEIAMRVLAGKKTFEHPKIIRELAEMRIIEAIPLIKNCLKFKNDQEIQIEASVALMMLQLDNPELGMENLTHMTTGQKMYFIESCKKLDPAFIPNFSNGFTSNNIHVVEICLILCDYFKQNYPIEIVRSLLKTKEPNILFAAGFLIFRSGNHTLIKELLEDLISLDDTFIQVTIIKNIKLLDKIELIDDLLILINNPNTVDELKLEAIRSACRLAEKFNQEFKLSQIIHVDEKVERMYLHAQEKLI